MHSNINIPDPLPLEVSVYAMSLDMSYVNIEYTVLMNESGISREQYR